MEPFVGEVRMFAGRIAPRGWVFCDGRELPVSGYEILYSLIGNTWGGDATKFNVPDMRNRIPVGVGTGPSLSPRVLGQTGGADSVTLSVGNIPAHNHALMACNTVATMPTMDAGVGFAQPPFLAHGKQVRYVPPSAAPTKQDLDSQVLTPDVGGSLPHENRMPCLGITFIMATTGLYPERP